MARTTKTRSRVIRIGLLSASILGFLPVFGLVRGATGGTEDQTTAIAAAPATAAPARTPAYDEPYSRRGYYGGQTRSQNTAPAQPQQSATTHTRSHAS